MLRWQQAPVVCDQHQRDALLAVELQHQLHHGAAGGMVQSSGGLILVSSNRYGG